MATHLTHPGDNPPNKTYGPSPERLSVTASLNREDAMKKMYARIDGASTITQRLLRDYMLLVLDELYDLREFVSNAHQRTHLNMAEVREASLKADNALRATEVVIKMGKMMGEK